MIPRRYGLVAALSVVVSVCLAAGGHALSTERGAPTYVPAEWRRIGRAPRELDVPVGFAVAQPGRSALAGVCAGVSEPTSASYGNYLSIDDLTELLGASANHDTVVTWLRTQGATDVHSAVNRDHVTASLPVSRVEAAFGVEMHVYADDKGTVAANDRVVAPPRLIVRASSHPASLPSDVAAALDLILGLTDFPPPRRRSRRARAAAAGRQSGPVSAAGAAPPAASSAAAVPAPMVTYAYVNDSAASYVLEQVCPGTNTVANGTVPCAGFATPIKWQTSCLYNDRAPVDVPWSNVHHECSFANNGCSYLVTVDHAYSPDEYVNCSLRAVVTAGPQAGTASAWASLPWRDVPPEWQGLLVSPAVTPQFMWDYYGLPKATHVEGATQAVAAFTGNFYKPSDLATFYRMYGVDVTGSLIDHGMNNPAKEKAEGTLDIEWLTAASPASDTTYFYQEGDPVTRVNSFVLGLALAVNNITDPPRLFSISYGATESFFESVGGPMYIPRCNAEFQKLCARGVTLVVAAGDGGSTNDGHGGTTCKVDAFFPGSSPWVTSVSATYVDANGKPRPNSGAAGAGEGPVTMGRGLGWTTGGGFASNADNRQLWFQRQAVSGYLAQHPSPMPPPNMYNTTLRAYPDMSALGHNIMTVTGGLVQGADGTSAATPIVAGILSRLNAARLSAGQPVIGFANPLLYAAKQAAPESFHDILGPANNRYGFEVTPGFDAVTGLGSVGDYKSLESFVLQAGQ